MSFKNDNSLNDLINQAGKKTGLNPDNLKQSIDNGKLDNLVSKMKPEDAARFKEILNNPQLAQQMLNSPQAQMLIKKFMK